MWTTSPRTGCCRPTRSCCAEASPAESGRMVSRPSVHESPRQHGRRHHRINARRPYLGRVFGWLGRARKKAHALTSPRPFLLTATNAQLVIGNAGVPPADVQELLRHASPI